MKAIILCGGNGTRLYPLTAFTSKQLLPVYNKPMAYYSLSTILMAGIKDIAIIAMTRDIESYKVLLGDGSQLGVCIKYFIQDEPNGIPEAFLICKDFIGNDSVCLTLGDNIFYGAGFTKLLSEAKETVEKENKAVVFGYNVKDPERFGVIEYNSNFDVISVEEKPKLPKSNTASVGLYFFPNSIVEVAKDLKSSDRNELEIVDCINYYLTANKLKLQLLHRGFSWFDAGTLDSLQECSNFIYHIEQNTGFRIGQIEEIAYKQGFINKEELLSLANKGNKTYLGDYLKKVANE